MTLSERLESLRRELGLTVKAMGMLGVVRAATWYKLETGERQASEAMLVALVACLVRFGYTLPEHRAALLDELLTLKYLGSRDPFLRNLAGEHARGTPWGRALLARDERAVKGLRAAARACQREVPVLRFNLSKVEEARDLERCRRPHR